MNRFVPLTDDLLYEHPELLPARLVPFNLDYPCLHWLEETENAQEECDNDH